MVPIWSIISMLFTALLTVMLSFGLFLIFRKRLKLKVVPALTGAAAFIIFAMILEQILHGLVLNPAPDGSIALMSRPVLYTLYGAFAAGIFEETGRFISFKLLKRKFKGVNTALSYGIGHGGIEALLLAGLSMISTIALSLTVNSGAAETLGASPEITAIINTLTETPSWHFAISGLERAFAVVIHISLSVIVWHSVNTKGKTWLYPFAILLHALVDVAPALYQSGVIKSVALVEALVGFTALAFAFVAAVINKAISINAKKTETKNEA